MPYLCIFPELIYNICDALLRKYASIWEVYWNAFRNMYNRRDSLLYMFVCERYNASVEMERD
jgi:hypothetical protein